MQHTHIHTHIYLVDMRKMYAFKEMIDIGLFDKISSCNNCIGIVYTCICYITKKAMGSCLLEGTWDWLRWRNDPLSDMEKRLNVIHTYIHHTQLSIKRDGRGNLDAWQIKIVLSPTQPVCSVSKVKTKNYGLTLK